MNNNKSMTQCKSCGKEVAKGAKMCPNCGKDQRNFIIRHKVISVIIVIIVLGVIGNIGGSDNKSTTTTTTTTTASSTQTDTNTASTANNTAPAKEEEAPITISAVDLADAYDQNEVSADNQYKDKNAIITGTIDDIGVSLGQTYVVLTSGNNSSITDIQCFFTDKDQINKVAELKKGDTITVKGKINGKSLNVGVRNCTLQ